MFEKDFAELEALFAIQGVFGEMGLENIKGIDLAAKRVSISWSKIQTESRCSSECMEAVKARHGSLEMSVP